MSARTTRASRGEHTAGSRSISAGQSRHSNASVIQSLQQVKVRKWEKALVKVGGSLSIIRWVPDKATPTAELQNPGFKKSYLKKVGKRGRKKSILKESFRQDSVGESYERPVKRAKVEDEYHKAEEDFKADEEEFNDREDDYEDDYVADD